MLTAQYNKKLSKSLFIGLTGLILAGLLIWGWTPDKWWKEVVVVIIAAGSFLAIVSRILRNVKWGVISTVTILVFVILNRFRVLDLLTLTLLIIIMGLISLIY
jgi:hypothetical protein